MKLVSRSKKIQQQLVKPINSKKKKNGKDIENIHTELIPLHGASLNRILSDGCCSETYLIIKHPYSFYHFY